MLKNHWAIYKHVLGRIRATGQSLLTLSLKLPLTASFLILLSFFLHSFHFTHVPAV